MRVKECKRVERESSDGVGLWCVCLCTGWGWDEKKRGWLLQKGKKAGEPWGGEGRGGHRRPQAATGGRAAQGRTKGTRPMDQTMLLVLWPLASRV